MFIENNFYVYKYKYKYKNDTQSNKMIRISYDTRNSDENSIIFSDVICLYNGDQDNED